MKNVLSFLQRKGRYAGALVLLLMLSVAGNAFATTPDDSGKEKKDTWEIKGTVKDKNDEPIVGAAILERGTGNGTVTDTLGQFKLAVK